MALLPPPAARPLPKTTLSVRIENSMRELLDRYCEFAGCGRQHVVYEALRFTFQQDSDFQRWLESHGETSQQSGADWNLKDKPA